jgi:peptide/nickel transport system permease protein
MNEGVVRKNRLYHGLGLRFWTGSGLLVTLVAMSIVMPWASGQGVDDQSSMAYLSPSLANPFGTDDVGRDIFTRTAYGLRFDLMLIAISVPVSMILGTFLGMLRAFGNWLGEIGQRIIDIIVGVPSIILGIAISAALGPGALALGAAIIVASIPPFGRLTRSSILALEHKDFVLAARAFGRSPAQILLRHILPNTVPILLTQLPISLVMAIILEASLSVIGLGLPAPSPSLGGLISDGRADIYTQIWYVIGPTIVFAILAISLVLIAEGIKHKMVR